MASEHCSFKLKCFEQKIELHHLNFISADPSKLALANTEPSNKEISN